jgi:glycosyltransferase involved in cell wall biosynthesis
MGKGLLTMKTIHLVYPHDKTRRASAPWSIGYNLAVGLRKRGHHVQCYDWEDQLCIFPDSQDDILIGHPHPDPGKCFRTSMVAPWKMVASIAPWNGSLEYLKDQQYIWDKVDHVFSICGARWWPDPSMKLLYKNPRRNATRLDMAIDPQYFPPLKQSYNPPGQRRFLYIGCTVPIKGTDYLTELFPAPSFDTLAHIGHGNIPNIGVAHGYLDLQSDAAKHTISQYDFLIMPGIHDANPTTVLEAMAWGLIPVLSEGCGYTTDDYHGYKLTRTCTTDAELIESLQRAEETTLRDLASHNRDLVRSRYTWQRFVNSVALVLEA